MKKTFALLASLLLLTSSFPIQATETTTSAETTSAASNQTKDIMTITREAGYDVPEAHRPKSSIVIDAASGGVLWEDNADALRDPASMSKMFTLYLLFEEMAKGTITPDTTIVASESDQAISQIYEISNNKITAGVAYPIRDLIYQTVVPSSNAATIMIANYLSNNDANAFVDKINAKAQELGMTNTYFNNASGAVARAFQGYYNPDRYDIYAPNQTTARDLSTLIYNFLQKYPDILTYTKDAQVTTMAGTPYEETFKTYNHSLPGGKYALEGVDGLKTGSSPSAAFNAMVTAKRGDTRLITLVMGVGDWTDQNGEYYRHPFINALLEKGFADFPAFQAAQAAAAETSASTDQSANASSSQSFLDQALVSIPNFFKTYWLPILLGLIALLLTFLILILVEKRRRRKKRRR